MVHFLTLAQLCIVLGALYAQSKAVGPPTVKLDAARVIGVSDGVVNQFLGIPFAKPPAGRRRFRLPKPATRYRGVLNATTPGNRCFQQTLVVPPDIPSDAPPEVLGFLGALSSSLAGGTQSEDCLNLNVITPTGVSQGAELPVAVWIYGGGTFEAGSNVMEPGEVVVKRSIEIGHPVIFVAMNYRLNGWFLSNFVWFGFLGGRQIVKAGLGNLGLHDQRLALRWVQQYISAFGGDPMKVTIWGESAGAWSVTLQMMTNNGDTEGLFRAAWMESGTVLPTRSIRDLQPTFDFISSEVGCASSRGVLKCLRGVAAESLAAAIDKTPTAVTFESLSNPWTARFDGVFITDNSQRLVLNGTMADIPFVTGNNLDEGTLFTLAAFNITTEEGLADYLQSHYFPDASAGDMVKLLELYPARPGAGSPFGTGKQFALGPEYKRLAAIQGDLVFQGMRRFLLRKRLGKQVVRSYLNKRGSLPGLGVPHGSDLAIMFGGGDMTDFLIRFVATLDPNDCNDSCVPPDTYWPAYTPESPQMLVFKDGKKTLKVVNDTFREEAIDASSSVLVSHKLDDQLPPIARIHSPFSWTFSPETFLSTANATLTYSASALPAWLSFDPGTHTLHGTPESEDEGSPRITVTAQDPKSDDSASSSVTLCVTPYPPPELHIPVEKQFTGDNPSLSSVFLVHNNSALYNSKPALRVPPKWSYSIGFQYNTFIAPHSLYYAATQADGSPLPDWINFNERAMTFGGVTPRPEQLSGPQVVSLVLHASDQEGYSAMSVPFDLVVAAHDMTLATASLPTINVTADSPFELTLNSAVDFTGVLIDDEPLSPTNITALDIDTSGLEGWLRYNATSRTLSGQPPSGFSSGLLPVTLTSSVNQTIQTEVTLAAVPSFFTTPDLQPILVNPGSAFSFDLAQDFSNSSGLGNQNSGVNLTAAFDPPQAGDYLHFDSGSALLSGTVPSDISYSHIAVTFTAYSRITHSTSHTSLPLSLSTNDYAHQHNKTGGMSGASRAKLVLGLKIAFGIISAFVSIAIAFAVLRRCTHVPDSAVVGEEGRRAWTDAEMKWYGIGIEVDGQTYGGPKDEEGYGWNEGQGPSSPGKEGTGFGAALSRVLTRTISNTTGAGNVRSPLSPASLPQSPGVMKKAEFLGKIRATARVVSDKYRRVVSGPKRPTISKPTLIMTSDNRAAAGAVRPSIDGLPVTNDSYTNMPHFDPTRYAPSGLTSLINSPSSSTDARSVPRRRADFAPPRQPAPAHTAARRQSAKSLASSLETSSSSRTHEAEAVVQRATRAMSVRSAMSIGALSFQSASAPPEPGRPRLVPFTSAARVPVPKLPSSFFSPDPNEPLPGAGASPGAGPRRVASQMAKVFRNVGGAAAGVPAESADELKAGIEYVRALGDDGRSLASRATAEPSPVPSFSSLDSSQHGYDGASAPAPRMLARVGERFRYRVATSATPTAELEVRLRSGKPLPRFVRAVLDPITANARGDQRMVELCGTPAGLDVGELQVGVYVKGSGECVGNVVVEVVERKSG
ncbi:Alpha/Beta hydrolase protein [Trametes polyzona]|nr:Alpha/Beta hydrolase protein [Trametes polyzona]